MKGRRGKGLPAVSLPRVNFSTSGLLVAKRRTWRRSESRVCLCYAFLKPSPTV